MSYHTDVCCIRCGRKLTDEKFYTGCPVCASEGVNVNFTTCCDVKGEKLPPHNNGQPGIYRFREFYPISDSASPVSLQEGNTPLMPLKRLGQKLGIANLYAKDETRNPTLSYKDRLCSLVVTKAVQDKAPVITISSTGNHGASAAAYAAAAGIPCVIFTVGAVPETMKTLMQAYGACVVVVPTSLDRWKIMGQCVRELGWVPASGFMSPPIGSNCYGVDGYKSIAFELYEQLGDKAPDMVIMPSAYSDGLYGTYKGMCDLKDMGYIEKLPKMVASEVFGSMQETLRQDAQKPVTVDSQWSVAFSIGGGTCTYQGLEAVKKSAGYARASCDEETRNMQLLLASTEGIYAESASVTTLVAAQKLAAEGKISADDKVVVVLTSTGLKDPAMTKESLPGAPEINPNMDELRAALKNSYGVNI